MFKTTKEINTILKNIESPYLFIEDGDRLAVVNNSQGQYNDKEYFQESKDCGDDIFTIKNELRAGMSLERVIEVVMDAAAHNLAVIEFNSRHLPPAK